MSNHPAKKKSVLSTELILNTSLRLAEQAGGVTKLSLRQLGRELGIDPTATYRYFSNKDGLVAAMANRIYSEMMPSDEELKGDWRTRLTAIAERSRCVFLTYPTLTLEVANLDSAALDVAVTDRFLEVGYQALVDAGLRDEDVVVFYELLLVLTLGLGLADATAFGADPATGRQVLRDRYSTLRPEEFPNVSRLAAIALPENDAVFTLGLATYLDAVAQHSEAAKASKID